MTDIEDYRDINRLMWDGRAAAHEASPDYGVQRFAEDSTFLSAVVRFDVPLLGDLTGLRGVHLQCHIGTDTVSLSRLGAEMTGLDLSTASLTEARKVADAAGADVDFVESEVYAAPAILGTGRFDLVQRDRGPVLAARHRRLGRRRRHLVEAGWPALPPRGAPGVVVDR